MTCPYIVTSNEGTSYCRLAEESVRERDQKIKNLQLEINARTNNLINNFGSALEDKDQQIQILKEALEFYADKGNWVNLVDKPSLIESTDESIVGCASGIYTVRCGGKRARETLAKLNQVKGEGE